MPGQPIESMQNNSFIHQNAEDIRLVNLHPELRRLPVALKTLESDLVPAEIDIRLVQGYKDFFANAIRFLDDLINLDFDSIYAQFVAGRDPNHIVIIEADPYSSHTQPISAGQVKQLKERAQYMKARLESIMARSFIVDRYHYALAIESMAKKVIEALARGEIVNIFIQSTSNRNDARSNGYVAYLVARLVESQLIESGREHLLFNLEVGFDARPDTTYAFVCDDFLHSGQKFGALKEKARSKLAKAGKDSVPIYGMAIAGDEGFLKKDVDFMFIPIPPREDSIFLTSTTTDIDYSFSLNSSLPRILKELVDFPHLKLVCDTPGSEAEELLIQNKTSFPRLADRMFMQAVKPYLNSPVRDKMKSWYASRGVRVFLDKGEDL